MPPQLVNMQTTLQPHRLGVDAEAVAAQHSTTEQPPPQVDDAVPGLLPPYQVDKSLWRIAHLKPHLNPLPMCWLMHLVQERSSPPGDGSSTGASDGDPAAASLHAGDQGDLLGLESTATDDAASASAEVPQRELLSHPLASLI